MDLDLDARAARRRQATVRCSCATSGRRRRKCSDEVNRSVKAEFFKKQYADVFKGDEQWQSLDVPKGETYAWDPRLHLREEPAVLRGHDDGAAGHSRHHRRARARDARRFDHDRPHLAGRQHSGVEPGGQMAGRARRREEGLQLVRRATRQSRSDDARHVRQHPPAERDGARHRRRLVGDRAGRQAASSSTTWRWRYQKAGTPLVIVAGKEYGTGSSRDWAAKGTLLLGVRAVIAESFERIHRSNLVGMGVLPLEFTNGDTRQSLGLTGSRRSISWDSTRTSSRGRRSRCASTAARAERQRSSSVLARIDTPEEMNYYKNGGILPYVLRQLVGGKR